MHHRAYVAKRLGLLGLSWVLCGLFVVPATAQKRPEKNNMELVGYNDLQGRGAYMPVVHKQGDRWIAYIGAQTGTPERVNPLTGKVEFSGTSIVDVTDPKNPKYLVHIPGETRTGGLQPSGTGFAPGRFPPGEAEFMQVCDGSVLPHADKSKFYMLRVFGHSAWEMWDVTDPAKPNKMYDIVSGLTATHRPWWECDTGIAYLPAGLLGWPIPPSYTKRDSANHLLIYDLSDPAKATLMRHWGLPGQNPGSPTRSPIAGLHCVLSTGSKTNRVYITYGNDSDGIWLILDREKLLNGPKEPTDENLRYPIIARVDYPRDMGAHTVFPLPRMEIPEFGKQEGKIRDFVAVVSQQVGNECQKGNDGQDGSRQMVRIFDVTTESSPVGVAAWTVPEASGNFCSKGGRFGPHGSQEEFTPPYYKRVLFVSYYNAGVRALDIRDPYNPKEIAYFIPEINNNTEERCVGEGADRRCKKAIQTNNVTVDARGYIYIVDHAGSGMHILELTGPARQVADFSQVAGSAGRQ